MNNKNFMFKTLVFECNTNICKKKIVRTQSRHIFYYSFWIGLENERRKNWDFYDIKIAACDVRTALLLFDLVLKFGSMDSFQRVNFDLNRIKPSQELIMQVWEFQKVKRTGATLDQFKKINVYYKHDLIKHFGK
jgi:hypothetical protein